MGLGRARQPSFLGKLASNLGDNMVIKSKFWHILQKEIEYRKRVAKEHQKNMFTIHKVKKDLVVVKVEKV